MRFTPAAIGAALILASLSTATSGQVAPIVISPVSLALMAEGERLQKAGDLNGAGEFYESSLAADPRNSNAYVALGQIAQARGLTGSAIRHYREALALNPDDLDALAGEGSALAQKGAINRARDTLARLTSACRTQCPQIARLQTAIATGPTQPVVASRTVEPRPVLGQIPPPAPKPQ